MTKSSKIVLGLGFFLPLASMAAEQPRLKCMQGDIKDSVAFYVGKNGPTQTKDAPNEVTLRGKKVPILTGPQSLEALSEKPFVTEKDFEFIEAYSSEMSQICDENNVCKNMNVLGFSLTSEGKKKMRTATKENRDKVLLIQAGNKVVASPVIKEEVDNAVLTPGSNLDAYVLLRSLCKKKL